MARDMNVKASSVRIWSCIFEKSTCRCHACCSSRIFFAIASFVLRPHAHAHPSCVRNFPVIFFFAFGGLRLLFFLCRSMPSASLMTLNLSRSIGTRARRHAHTATNTCNTATHTRNTATHTYNTATHLENSCTTATQQPCCIHAPVHTSACTRPHRPKRLHTPGRKKKGHRKNKG